LTNHSKLFVRLRTVTTCAREQRWSGKITDRMCDPSQDSATEHRGTKLRTVTVRWLACRDRAPGQLPKLVLCPTNN